MKTPKRTGPRQNAEYQTLLLGGVRYAVIPEDVLRHLCSEAGIAMTSVRPEMDSVVDPQRPDPYDSENLAQRISTRRKAAGLTQAELASRAEVRIETLNRIERGKTNPDFSTIRKLVTAIQQVESGMP